MESSYSKTLTQGPEAREATRSPGFTHTDQTVDQAGVVMFLTAPLEGTTGVGGVHGAQDVGQGYEGDQEGEEKKIIQQGGSPGGLHVGLRNVKLFQKIFYFVERFRRPTEILQINNSQVEYDEQLD